MVVDVWPIWSQPVYSRETPLPAVPSIALAALDFRLRLLPPILTQRTPLIVDLFEFAFTITADIAFIGARVDQFPFLGLFLAIAYFLSVNASRPRRRVTSKPHTVFGAAFALLKLRS